MTQVIEITQTETLIELLKVGSCQVQYFTDGSFDIEGSLNGELLMFAADGEYNSDSWDIDGESLGGVSERITQSKETICIDYLFDVESEGIEFTPEQGKEIEQLILNKLN